MSGKLLALKTFTYPSEAYALKGRLESEGIYCFLENEHTIGVHPFASNAIGGAVLKVHEIDFEKAVAVLEAIEKGNGDSTP